MISHLQANKRLLIVNLLLPFVSLPAVCGCAVADGQIPIGNIPGSLSVRSSSPRLLSSDWLSYNKCIRTLKPIIWRQVHSLIPNLSGCLASLLEELSSFSLPLYLAGAWPTKTTSRVCHGLFVWVGKRAVYQSSIRDGVLSFIKDNINYQWWE